VKKFLDEPLKALEGKLIAYRRDFHKHAEVGWGEYRTASVIAQRLEESGYKVKIGREVLDEKSRMGLPDQKTMRIQYSRALSEGADPRYAQKLEQGFTGVVGELRNAEGPTIGFRFDIDAVPVHETDEKEHVPSRENFSSVHPEVMHSCGHDGHAAIGLGLSEILSKMKDNFTGTIKLIFQPAEEGVRGAKAMVEAGVVDDLDYLFGMHIGLKAHKTGEFFCGTRGFLATSKFDAYFKGITAHPAFDPHKGRNALLSATTAALNLQAIPRHGEGRTWVNVGKIYAGTGRNVIPADAHLVIETRGENSELNGYMKSYAERIVRSSAEMHGTEFSIIQMGEAESGESDAALTQAVYNIARKNKVFPVLQRENADPVGVSEDFTHMMKRVTQKGGKASYLVLGSDMKGNHHAPDFDIDESVLIKGVEILALIAIELKV
jgi:aminobenzoyl-glutamate utilization protein A